ncbi:MAG TPA: glycosyltransferase [Acidimicrobiales bacterium]|nr:glycosyltransferase [Acidimicrobiales bacterium]
MRVGVALASWNGAAFVEQQLTSIARQTRRPDDLVVSDDASSDATPEIVERVSAETQLPLRLLRGTARAGVVANFERAISAVDADVIVLCDQDDAWHEGKLARIEQAFAGRPNLGGVFSDGRIVDQAGRSSGATLWGEFGFGAKQRQRAARVGMTEVLLRKNVVTGATLAFAGPLRDLILPLGRAGLHDVWIALLVAATAGLEPLPDKLIDYRIHSSNAEGLGVRDPAAAVSQRATARKSMELQQFESILQRLEERAPERASNIRLLEAKVEHLRFRCELPTSALQRAARIGTALPSYARFSSGWRSPLLDLVAPARSRPLRSS